MRARPERQTVSTAGSCSTGAYTVFDNVGKRPRSVCLRATCRNHARDSPRRREPSSCPRPTRALGIAIKMRLPPNLMTLADLSPGQIQRILTHARYLKQVSLPWLAPQTRTEQKLRMPSQSLFSKSVALLFSKRSTRTRIAAETAATLLGGRALFLGKEDIQLGVNESMRDSARVIGGMCQGIFARVGDHAEIEVCCPFLVRLLPTVLTLAVCISGTGAALASPCHQRVVITLASHSSSRRPPHTAGTCVPLRQNSRETAR